MPLPCPTAFFFPCSRTAGKWGRESGRSQCPPRGPLRVNGVSSWEMAERSGNSQLPRKRLSNQIPSEEQFQVFEGLNFSGEDFGSCRLPRCTLGTAKKRPGGMGFIIPASKRCFFFLMYKSLFLFVSCVPAATTGERSPAGSKACPKTQKGCRRCLWGSVALVVPPYLSPHVPKSWVPLAMHSSAGTAW